MKTVLVTVLTFEACFLLQIGFILKSSALVSSSSLCSPHIISPLVKSLHSLGVTGLTSQINFDYPVGKTAWFWRVRDFKMEWQELLFAPLPRCQLRRREVM